jgi:formylglycine-generating enzyme required for sulfatase activity
MKTKLHSLFILLALHAGVDPAQAQPALGIALTNNQAILFWPTMANGTNGVLQSTTNLVSPNWLSVTDAFPVNHGSQTAISVTNTSSARFFRLALVSLTADGMAFIPAGTFTMGDSIGDSDITDANPINIYVSAFVMDVNLVNYGLWTNVYAYATKHGYNFADVGGNGGTGTNYPVIWVDWFD